MTTAVAVTGMGVCCAAGTTIDQFARRLRLGDSGIVARACRSRGGPSAWAPLPPVVEGSASGPPREDMNDGDAVVASARATGRRAPEGLRASLEVAIEAWHGARLQDGQVSGDEIGLIVAGSNLGLGRTAQLHRRVGAGGRVPPRYGLQLFDTDHVGLISQALGITGEGCTIGGASASGGVALAHGARAVRVGAVTACLVVGAPMDLSPLEEDALCGMGAMSVATFDPPALACRPFDRGATGFVYGQGAACLVLEDADEAARRGVEPLVLLVASALSLDGNSLAAPNPTGEVHVMAEAVRRAGIKPEDVDYVNAHGSGAPLGDAVEAAAMGAAFGQQGGKPWVNSTKAITGHCLSSAGVVEAVATVVQLCQGFVHPNLFLTDPIDCTPRWAGPVAVDDAISVAVSNSFGFGGFNTSVVFAKP